MPGDPRWSGPPEVIAETFEAGSPASVVSNNMVWVTETAHHELAAGLSVANTAATQDSWAGQGSIASALAAAALNAGIHTTMGWTAHKIMVTQGAVDVFTTAQSSVVPAVVIKANRAEREAMAKANLAALGTLTPAIVERDLAYFGEHWPHNANVGWGYSSAMSAFTAASPSKSARSPAPCKGWPRVRSNRWPAFSRFRRRQPRPPAACRSRYWDHWAACSARRRRSRQPK
jgi:hypothetical protein